MRSPPARPYGSLYSRRYEGEFGLLTVKLGANNRESRETTQRVVRVMTNQKHDRVYQIKNDKIESHLWRSYRSAVVRN